MARVKDPFFRRLHPKLTDEQCCQLVAMRDVQGIKAAENHYGIDAKTQNKLSKEVKSRPHLDIVYWQYRNSIARRWVNGLGETMQAVLAKISETVANDDIDLLKLRELTRTVEVLGDIGVSVTAIAPEAIEQETPRYEVIDIEAQDDQLLLEGADDATS